MLIVLFVSLLLLYSIIGIWNARAIKNVTDFLVAAKSLSLPVATAGLVVTQLGGGVILETARKGFEYGIYGLFYPLGIALGLLLLHQYIGRSWYELNVQTTAGLFKITYNSRFLHKLAAIIFCISLCGLLVAQAIALRSMICPSISWGHYCLFGLTWLCTVFYTATGGLRAVVTTDVMQGILIYGFFIALLLVIFIIQPYSLSELTHAFVAHPLLPKEITFRRMFLLFALPALFVLIGQDIIQYIMKSRTIEIAVRATSLSTPILIAFSFIPFMCGMIAKKVLSTAPLTAPIIIQLIEQTLPTWVLYIGLCAISAAIISTIDSILIAITTHITNDLLPRTQQSLATTRVIVILVGLLAFVSSFYVAQNIISIILFSYELSLSILFMPIMASFFLPKNYVTTQRAWISVALGAMSYAANLFILPEYLPTIIITLGLTALPFLIKPKRRTVHT